MNEDRAREAVDHLQTAALELIAAVRAALDVAEEFIREPTRPGRNKDDEDDADDDLTHIDIDTT